MVCGIYSITSPSGNKYIGSSVQIEERWRQHKRALVRGDHFNQCLQRAFDKYNNQLKFNTLLICDPEDLLLYEQQYLDFYKPEYNIRIIAESNRGIKQRPEVILKRANANRGRKNTPEAIARMRQVKLGKKLSEDTKLKLSMAGLGRKDSFETRQRKREAALRREANRRTSQSKEAL